MRLSDERYTSIPAPRESIDEDRVPSSSGGESSIWTMRRSETNTDGERWRGGCWRTDEDQCQARGEVEDLDTYPCKGSDEPVRVSFLGSG